MAYCTACGNQVQGDSKFCSRCGASVEPTRSEVPSHTNLRRTSWTNSFWKRGGVIVGVIVVLIIILGQIELDNPSNEAENVIVFGTGEIENSNDLEISGMSEDFTQGEKNWLRMTLSKEIGSIEIRYFLQSQDIGESGWSSVDSWTVNIDPDSNLFRSRPFDLQLLDPANYQVFAVSGDKKRAEGTFAVVEATPKLQ